MLRGMKMRGRNYRAIKGMAYTKTKYIHGAPPSKITKFMIGDAGANYKYRVSLIAQNDVQIRHNALEAARIAANKVLTNKIGETGYLLQICVYPHVVLRENKMIATAGADRLQEGMRRSFGKPVGRAARVKANKPIIHIYANDNTIQYAKDALKVCASKLPTPCRIVTEKIGED
jgi:large subunit ribosomal protein L10e